MKLNFMNSKHTHTHTHIYIYYYKLWNIKNTICSWF